MKRYADVPQTRICYTKSYVYVLQNRICYAQSSKCSYVKFRKNFGELFHNFGELLVMWEIKFKMQFCNFAQLGLGNSTIFAISMYLFTIFHYTIGLFWSILEKFAKS